MKSYVDESLSFVKPEEMRNFLIDSCHGDIPISPHSCLFYQSPLC